MICKDCGNKVSRYQITHFTEDERIIDSYYGCATCDHRWEEHTVEKNSDI